MSELHARKAGNAQVLGVCALAAMVAFLDVTVVNVAFPSIEKTFSGAHDWTVSWVMSSYNITFSALLVPSGKFADLFGHRRTFLVGMALFTVASAGCAASIDVWMLIAFRALQAVGSVAVIPAGAALLLDEYPPERRMEVTGMLGAASAVAAAFGPTVGAALIDVSDWRAAFLVNLPLGVITVLWGMRVLRARSGAGGDAAPDWSGGVVLIAGLAAIVFGLVQSDTWGWGNGGVIGGIAVGAVLVVVAVIRSRRHPAPAIELSLLRIRAVSVANLALVVFTTAMYAKILVDVLYMTDVWHWNIVYIGLALAPGPFVTAVCAPLTTRIAGRYGPRTPATVGAVVYGIGCAWFALRPGLTPSYFADWLPGSILTGIGNGLAFPVLSGAAVASLPPGRFGSGTALNAAARQLGAVLGVALLTVVVGAGTIARHSLQDGFWFTAIVSLAAAPIAAALGRQTPLTVDAPPEVRPSER
ncbi:MFS transporter [Actinoallomurus spadix]|uniref:Major facilitator superfamily (MFS) profile domain-containing protein n=1 Tax=Actinoallomurus spadix TaxID=79912 RepID=A0ABN0W1U9_9ACTN|nr:MFS transporter [Actinoallomurus spadix]MCO5985367.1 MFS transporter [Actinoallomurus spadix]